VWSLKREFFNGVDNTSPWLVPPVYLSIESKFQKQFKIKDILPDLLIESALTDENGKTTYICKPLNSQTNKHSGPLNWGEKWQTGNELTGYEVSRVYNNKDSTIYYEGTASRQSILALGEKKNIPVIIGPVPRLYLEVGQKIYGYIVESIVPTKKEHDVYIFKKL
jgi:hypothetical protein